MQTTSSIPKETVFHKEKFPLTENIQKKYKPGRREGRQTGKGAKDGTLA